jgi:hypothetical protein
VARKLCSSGAASHKPSAWVVVGVVVGVVVAIGFGIGIGVGLCGDSDDGGCDDPREFEVLCPPHATGAP